MICKNCRKEIEYSETEQGLLHTESRYVKCLGVKGEATVLQYSVKVEITVTEVTDDFETVYRTDVRANSSDLESSMNFAEKVNSSAKQILNEMRKK